MGDMNTTFENKVKILSRLNKSIEKNTTLKPVANRISLGLNLATAIDYGIVTEHNDKISLAIDSGFGFVLTTYGLEDTGFEKAWEIDPNLTMPTIWIEEDSND